MQTGSKRVLSYLALFLGVWLGLRYVLPLFSPFLLGLGLALAAEPMVSFLNRRARVPRGVSAGIGVSMAFCFLAMVLLLICAFLVRQLRMLAGILPDLEGAAASGTRLLHSWLLELAGRMPQSVQPVLRENLSALFSDGAALVDGLLSWLVSLAGNLLSHIPDSALGLGTAVVSGFMISVKLPLIRQWLRRRLSGQRLKTLLAAGKRMRRAVTGWLMAQCKLMGVTFAILLGGLWLLKIPYAPAWAAGISLVDVLPVLGTGTVLLPWSLICLLQGEGVKALGLAGVYVIITLTRSMLEPKLLGRHLGLDPLVTLMAMYLGYQLWGVGGMLLAPVLAVAAAQLAPEAGREAS